MAITFDFDRQIDTVWEQRQECIKEVWNGSNENELSRAIKPYDEDAASLARRYYHEQDKRAGILNICTARPNWDSCSYADCGFCEVSEGGFALCWKQDGKSDCCKCREVNA